MDYTVKDALTLDVLAHGRVIAGKAGLHRIIKKISVLEIPFHSDETSMEEDLPFDSYELVISALYAVAQNEKAQIKILEALNKCDCSGLILCYVDTWMKTISKEFIATADRLSFPVIMIPSPITYSEIITAVMDKVLNIQSKNLKHHLYVHEEMTKVILQGKDIGELLHVLETMIHHKVLYYDAENQWVMSSGSHLDSSLLKYLDDLLTTQLLDLLYQNEQYTITLPDSEAEVYITPLTFAPYYYGSLLILEPQHLSELDQISISQAKSTIAMISLNQVRINHAISTNRREFIYNILKGNFENESLAIAKASALNISIADFRMVMVIHLIGQSHHDDSAYNSEELQVLHPMIDSIYSSLTNMSSAFLIHTQEDKVVVLLSDLGSQKRNSEYAVKVCNKLISSISTKDGFRIFAGIGNYYAGILKLKNSYEEALLAGRTIGKLSESGTYAEYKDYRLLCDINQQFHTQLQFLGAGSADLLSPLIEYDQAHDSQLFLTFVMILKNPTSPGEVADSLFIHKNTLLQRKKRIEQILMCDPFSYPLNLQYQLALLIRDLL
ncbi:MAG: PucR family transcriptional regulator [Lachnospiraceae bacterium]